MIGFTLPSYNIGLKISRHVFIRWAEKADVMVNRSQTLSRASQEIGDVFTSSFDWFSGLFVSFVTGSEWLIWFSFKCTNLKAALSLEPLFSLGACCILFVGVEVGPWPVVWSTSERAVYVRALGGGIVLCSRARHLTVLLSTYVYEWVPTNFMVGVCVWWLASHPGKRSSTPASCHALRSYGDLLYILPYMYLLGSLDCLFLLTTFYLFIRHNLELTR